MGACSKFHSNLLEIRCREKYCDVNVRVQDALFPCHRVVLAAASAYFEAMFGGDFEEKTARETTLHDIDKDTFREVLDFMYLGQHCTISVGNVYQLLQASSFLRIDSVENGCIEFILENISSIKDHIVQIFALARCLNMTRLVDALSIHIVRNFKSFYDDERFLELPFDDLQSILSKWKQDKLPIKHENLLLDLLIRWVHFTPEDRRKYLNELVQVVDFERISPQYISFMLKYFTKLTEIPNYGETSTQDLGMIKEGEFNDLMPKDWSNIQDSQSRWLLKKTIAEYFVKNDQFSSTCEDMTPVSIPSPKSYKDELGLHIYVEYTRHDRERCEGGGVPKEERIKNSKVLSVNKYQPDWFISCETKAWYSCNRRKIVSLEPTNLLYCLETFDDENTNNSQRQTFCTYTSTDMRLASNILSPPPIAVNNFNMCAVQNNIYLLNDKLAPSYMGPILMNNTFSRKQLDRGFFRYSCEVDKWFAVPRCQPIKHSSCLAVDGNLLYVISSYNVQAFDTRDGNWMNIPSCRSKHSSHSQSCTLNGKLYITNGRHIENFDVKAGKWEILQKPIPHNSNDSPTSSLYYSHLDIKKFLAYENMLWIIAESNRLDNDFLTATYNFISQEWYVSEKLGEAIRNFQPEEAGYCYYSWKMKDAIVFKTTVSS